MPMPSSRIAVVLVALAAAPAGAQPEKLIAQVQKAGGTFRMDPDNPAVPVSFAMGANASDRELEACGQLKTLRKVSLMAAGNRVTDRGVVALAGLADLEELHVGYAQLTDAGLARLQGLRKLKKLSLTATKVSDRGLGLLKDFPALEWLDVGKVNVTAAGLGQLAGCKGLQTLFINDQPTLTDAALEKLAGLPDLNRLEFARTPKVTDKGLAHLKKAPLQRLVVVGCDGVTDAGVKELKDFAKLTDLELWNCKGVTDKSVPALGGLAKLEKLVLSSTGVSKRGADQIKQALPTTMVTSR